MANLRVNGQERTYDGDPSMPLSGTCAMSWR